MYVFSVSVSITILMFICMYICTSYVHRYIFIKVCNLHSVVKDSSRELLCQYLYQSSVLCPRYSHLSITHR